MDRAKNMLVVILAMLVLCQNDYRRTFHCALKVPELCIRVVMCGFQQTNPCNR